MSQITQANFTLSGSGAPFKLPNTVVAGSGNLVLTYTVSGNPASLTIAVEGVLLSSGDVTVLDSVSTTTSTTRTVALSTAYDFFRFIAYSPTPGVSVAVSALFAGPGQTINVAQNLTTVHTA